MKQIIRSSVLWVVLLIGGLYTFRYLNGQWQRVNFSFEPQNITRLVFSLVLYCVGLLCLPIGSLVMQRWFGYNLPMRVIWRSFFLSQMSKYLPGGIWSVVGRAYLFSKYGVSSRESAALVALELAGFVGGSIVVGTLSLRVFAPLVIEHATGGVLSGLFVLVLGTLFLLAFFRDRWLPLFSGITPKGIALIVAISSAIWVLLGFAFCSIAIALGKPLSVIDMLTLVGVHAIAWLIGFLCVFAPGGIGVRDSILALGLTLFMATPDAVLVTVLARLGWTIAELVGLLVSSYLPISVSKDPTPPR